MFDADEQVLGQEQSDQKASGGTRKKGGFPCRGQIFIESLLTRPRCARRKWRTHPKRTNLKRLRRNGQRWRNGSSNGIDLLTLDNEISGLERALGGRGTPELASRVRASK